jgi:FMN phosphatase YigB (HAD superfamily)
MVKKTLFFVFLLLSLSIDAKRYLVIWDLGDTLVYVSIFGMVSKIGIADCAWYHIFNTKEKDQLQNLIFDVLEEYGGKQDGPDEEKSYHTAHRPLPKIMHLWLEGKILKPEKLVKKIHRKIDQLYGSGYFASNLEYRIVKNAIAAMFNPEVLVKNTCILKDALEIVQEIAQKGIHQQTILSNWDGVSFDNFKTSPTGQELARYFNMDQIIISGTLKLVKPQKNIFDRCLERYGVPLENCVFIDDQRENVDAARRYGITSIQIKNHDFKQLRKELKSLGVL